MCTNGHVIWKKYTHTCSRTQNFFFKIYKYIKLDVEMIKETNEHPKKEREKWMRQNKKNTKKDIRKNVQNLNVTLLGLRVF